MDRKCSFCDQKQSNYVCPKCGQYYCSVNCYKHPDHLKCSEEFYKDWVMSEITSKSFSSDLKKKTLEMLKRINLNNELDLNPNEFVNNNVDDLRSHLTHDELEIFNKMLKTGSIFNLLPASFWDPWYFRYKKKLVKLVSEKDEITKDKSEFNISKHGSKMVSKLENKILTNNIIEETKQLKTDNSESDCDLQSSEDDIPEIRESLPLKELISKEVSPSVACSIINTIFCYCYICRRFTGDHLLTPKKSYRLLMRISLLPKLKYDSTEEAIQFSCRKLIEEEACPLRMLEQLLIDTLYIVKNYNDLVFRLLSDLINLCSKKMTSEMKQEKKLVKKKLEFFLSWSKACGDKLILEHKKIELELFSIREQCIELKSQPKKDILFKINEDKCII